MNEELLGKKLKEMYDEGKVKKETATKVHLFGIRYSNELKRNDISIAKVIEISGIPLSYAVEVNKGKNLAKYVLVKESV